MNKITKTIIAISALTAVASAALGLAFAWVIHDGIDLDWGWENPDPDGDWDDQTWAEFFADQHRDD